MRTEVTYRDFFKFMSEEVSRHMGRREDLRFLIGHGRFTADLVPDDTLHAVFVRSAIARGHIRQIEVQAARAAPNIIAVLTADDTARDNISNMVWTGSPVRDDGLTGVESQRPLLSGSVIRHLGEPICMIVGRTRQSAMDAAELINISYEADQEVALTLGELKGPLVWPESPDNIASLHVLGDKVAVEAAIDMSAHQVHLDFDISKVAACPIEMRSALGAIDKNGRLCLTTSAQSPFALHGELADLFNLPKDQIRVLAPDVGGSFGMKGTLYREDALVVWAAKRLNKPVYWFADRSESFLSDEHARAVCGSAILGLDDDGMFTGLWVEAKTDAGAYLSRRTKGLLNNIGGVAGQYRTPAIAAELLFYFSNTMQTSPYRGFGRPEATYIIERLIDKAARQLGADALALRQKNLIAPSQMPYQTGLTYSYDCGDFPKVVAAAADEADYYGFARRREQSEGRGLLRGIGISNPIEVAGGPFKQVRKDIACITAQADGKIKIDTGLMSVGQGHETAVSRLASDVLNVPLEQIIYSQGDTDLLPEGRGNGGSAATVVGVSAVKIALGDFLSEAKSIASSVAGCPVNAVTYARGEFSAPGGHNFTWEEISRLSNIAGGLSVLSEFAPKDVTYPNGCHICEVEIDPSTGKIHFSSYVVVEDVGTVLNPELVEGQMHGGIAQGIGQALGEVLRFDKKGQLLTGSFLDYPMPIAADLPNFKIKTLAVPTKINPLGAKGVGEAGTVGALSATMNAISDALASAGVVDFEMPATPYRVWKALNTTR